MITQAQFQSVWLSQEVVGLSRKQVLLTAATAGSLVTGTVIGKVSATGKYKVCNAASTDGSEVPVAILADTTDVVVGDNAVVAVISYARVTLAKLIYDDAYDAADIQAALEAKLFNVQ